ncbi:hypothetical protein [Micrococcus endophyticus]|uniref:Short subunit dehydrogenase-like uncharacterized protein n=1 Tax=Micrococcus endophyticus TaxID=455343 RepID=A0A7W9JHB4_9MICC|nr:hypothetical protein [Micrococcus endophyticus]MBB5847714.1 short subunit dehydrogenase-like uncharacterized protein [Micrococcus endophyticus]
MGAAGTHYADLTGEALFVRDMIDAHHATAQATGARIVNSCGFDSVPSDLGVLLTAQQAAVDGEGTLTDTVLRVRSMRGGFSGGTVDSMRRQFTEAAADEARAAVVKDPYGLSPDRDVEPDRSGSGTGRGRGSRMPVAKDGESGRWEAPFVMAGYNTRVVRWSNTLTGWSYGRDFRYREVTDTGAGPRGLVRVAAARDPAYTGTAVMLGQAGLALAEDEDRLPARTGVLTPATALGDVLVQRLRDHGFTLETRRR